MRRAARVDANQGEIVKVLRRIGATVQHLSKVGEGCPDLLVGYHKRNFLLEIKDGAKPPSDRKLTPEQDFWHAMWAGQVHVVKNVDEALLLVASVEQYAC